jgi:hypothetical protein
MKLDRVSHVPYSQRVGRYHFQMVQAKLNTPVEPVFGYSLQPFYTRQDLWMTELSDSLSRLYRYSADLDKAAREFDPTRSSSAINQRSAISSRPEAAVAVASSKAELATYRLDIVRLANGERDADFYLDGIRHHSFENHFTMDGGNVRVALLQAGTDPIELTITPNTESLLHHTRLLVGRFNRLQAFLHEQQDTLATQKLDTFERVAQAADGVLKQYGIRLLSNGQLEMDDQKWLEAVQAGFADFEEAMKGLSKQFREETTRIQAVPLGSFSQSSVNAASAHPYLSTSMSSLQYQQAARTGLFVNLLW